MIWEIQRAHAILAGGIFVDIKLAPKLKCSVAVDHGVSRLKAIDAQALSRFYSSPQVRVIGALNGHAQANLDERIVRTERGNSLLQACERVRHATDAIVNFRWAIQRNNYVIKIRGDHRRVPLKEKPGRKQRDANVLFAKDRDESIEMRVK